MFSKTTQRRRCIHRWRTRRWVHSRTRACHILACSSCRKRWAK